MPGLTGYISKTDQQVKKERLDSMTQLLCHESYYESNSLISEELGIGVGWAVHKGSYSDCLPIWNEAKDICLIFIGEHFDNSSLVQNLRLRGHEIEDNNASVLVHLYEQEDARFFECLNGNFCGVLIDLRKNKSILFNDRYGLRRLYYHENEEGFFFSSESKCILDALPGLKQLDQKSLGEWFSCGCVMQDRSLYKEISIFPVASAWTFEKGKDNRKQTYFDRKKWEEQSILTPEKYKEELKEKFLEIIPGYLKGSQPVSLSLTGGLDSRMIVAAAAKLGVQLPSYTHAGIYRECEDVKVGRKVAQICNQEHQLIPIDSEFFSSFLTLASKSVFFTDGAMNASGASGLFMSQKARNIAPIRLTGNYGSEILRGHVAFKASSLSHSLFDHALIKLTQEAVDTYNQERAVHDLSFIAFKQVPWHHYARFAMEDSQVEQRSPYLDNDIVALAYRAPNDAEVKRDAMLQFSNDCWPRLASLPTDRGRASRPWFFPLGAWNWWKEFLPRAEYVYDYGMPNWFSKIDRIMRPFHFEKLFLGRQKYVHYRIWYKNELSKIVRDILLDPNTLNRSYLNKQQVVKVVTSHLKGTENHTTTIHQLLASELIHRKFIEES